VPVPVYTYRRVAGHWEAVPAHPDSNPFMHRGFSFDGLYAPDKHNAWAIASGPGSAILHSDGREWTVTWDSLTHKVQHWNPHPRDGIRLMQVARVNDKLMWASGLIYGSGADEPLLLRWNGKQWRQITVPALKGDRDFRAVAGVGNHDVWLAGEGVIAHARTCM